MLNFISSEKGPDEIAGASNTLVAAGCAIPPHQETAINAISFAFGSPDKTTSTPVPSDKRLKKYSLIPKDIFEFINTSAVEFGARVQFTTSAMLQGMTDALKQI
jgi:hypothetical protein